MKPETIRAIADSVGSLSDSDRRSLLVYVVSLFARYADRGTELVEELAVLFESWGVLPPQFGNTEGD